MSSPMFSIWHQLLAFLWIPLMVCDLHRTVPMEANKCGQLVNISELAYCCGMALLDKFLFVGTNCTEYWDNYGTCRYECLYRHWKLLDANNKIKKPELYTMITYLYNPLNGFNAYGRAFKDAHTSCEEVGTKHDDFVMLHASAMKEWTGLDSNCSPQAMLHAQCIMVHVTHNCPQPYWRAVEKCTDLRSLIPECVADIEVRETLDLKTSGRGGSNRLLLSGHFFLLSILISWILSGMLSDP